ncbi:hypothetical protein [Mitsuaria sp. 7]|uniref:hypothetical protein n=1 Tax=Mitsuaria sp. 7 TaxID=1658665 RepID=UPI0007DD71AD|nr:hypothetical protein [Mitsuaria sp. 7]ANH69821.1 hypothetical protein ABE85_23585 [Mitsuaria sp. 7]
MQASAEWTRDTPWRQGHVLGADACAAFGLKHAESPEATCVVVIGHDCDLANDNLSAEPFVEIIVGRMLPRANGNFSWGKAPRTLHVDMQRAGTVLTVELVATDKASLPKAQLARFMPDEWFELEAKQLAVLRNWLGARYNRTAFPDTFVSRMKSTQVDMRLAKRLEAKGALVSFIYFDLDGGEVIERPEGDPYELTIVLVFPPGADPDEASDQADQLAQEVFADCQRRLPSTDAQPNKDILLKGCFAISEDDITVAKSRELAQWRLEHMSLRATDEQLGKPEF